MNHDVSGSSDCAQCANPDLKGLHSCERYSMRSRLRQASAEPTFSYANGALDDAETIKRRAHESAVRQALASEAKAHVWEHKQPDPRLGQAMGSFAGFRAVGRTFTREEVLTVLRAQYAALHPATLGRPAVAEWLETLIGIFTRME